METAEMPPGSQTPSAGEHPFAEANVSFAVDCSGSTRGLPLQCELSFIARASQMLSPERRVGAKVIPWNSAVGQVCKLSDLATIRSGAGTDPRCILQHYVARAAVQESSLWFLMTDGLISKGVQEDFANMIPQVGIHGISCVTVIFGRLTSRAHSCNISVGVSVYALCPNALFLFYDTNSGDIIIMQAKGVFNFLLNGAENPVIDETTSWSSFPRLSLEALTDIVLPAPRKLKADEVALPGNLIVNFNDLWANKLSKEKVQQIFSNEENLTSVTMAMTSQGHGSSERYRSWLEQQQLQPVDPLRKPRKDVFAAKDIFLKLVKALNSSQSSTVDNLQSLLRRAHIDNMKAFLNSCRQQIAASRERAEWVASASKHSREAVSSARALNKTSTYRIPMLSKTHLASGDGNDQTRSSRVPPPRQRVPDPVANRVPQRHFDQDSASTTSNFSWVDIQSDAYSQSSGFVDVKAEFGNNLSMHAERRLDAPAATPISSNTTAVDETKQPKESGDIPMFDTTAAAGGQAPETMAKLANDSWRSLEALTTSDQSLTGLLWTQNFSSKCGSLTGKCGICGADDFTLAWLFKAKVAPSFPDAVKLSKASFPFADGCPRSAKDMLSSVICCEPCATYCVSTGHSLHNEAAVAALPMVRYAENKGAYQVVLEKLFLNSNETQLAHLFLSLILEASRTPVSAPDAAGPFNEAARWITASLVHAMDSPPGGSSTESLAVFLTRELNHLSTVKNGSTASCSTLIRWPLPGFILALQAAAALPGTTPATRRAAAFRRYLFAASEGFVLERVAKGDEAMRHRLEGLISGPSHAANDKEVPLKALSNALMIRLNECLELNQEAPPEIPDVGHKRGGAIGTFVLVLLDFVAHKKQGDAWGVFTYALDQEILQSALDEPEEGAEDGDLVLV